MKMKDYTVRPMIACMDGFRMSVQNHAGSYCNNNDTYEIGFPSEKENSIMEYAEEPERPTETVYGYVPEILINEIIEKHGGIDWRVISKLKS